jgi:EmrB/QacA subfamily drug resistance transporter
MARKWWTLLAACVATFMLLLDITVVNVALPPIQRDLKASFTDVQWVIDAYTLTLAAFVLTSGSLADRLGRRRVFAFGIVVFTLASLTCGLTVSPTMLNVSRAVQGLGGAVLFAVSLALVAQEFIGKERATALAVYGGTIGVAVAIGPIVGGVLTTSFGWRWIFCLNVPIGIAGLLVTLTRVRESRDPDARGVDWLGLITFGAANTMLVLGLLRGNQDGWTSPLIVGLFAGTVALFAVFLFIESRLAQPMLPLGYFRNRTFTGAQVAAFTISATMFAMFLYIILYVQNLLGYSPMGAALRFLPVTIASFLIAPLSGIAVTKVAPRLLLALGLGLIAAGLILMAGIHEGEDWSGILFGLILGGVGIGVVNPVLANVALSTVPEEHSGVASGINDTFRQVGIASGTAAMGALFMARAQGRVHRADAGDSRRPGSRTRQRGDARRVAVECPSTRARGGAPGRVRRAERDPSCRRDRRRRRRGGRARAGAHAGLHVPPGAGRRSRDPDRRGRRLRLPSTVRQPDGT